MRFTIRRLAPGDEDALARLTRVSHRFEHDPDAGPPPSPLAASAAEAFLSDPTVLFWLAESDGEPVGMCQCYVQRRGSAGPWAELLLYEIGVDIDHRRQGIGRALLDAMEAWMTRHGVAEVWVPSALEAVDFYVACGFRADEGVVMVKAPAAP